MVDVDAEKLLRAHTVLSALCLIGAASPGA